MSGLWVFLLPLLAVVLIESGLKLFLLRARLRQRLERPTETKEDLPPDRYLSFAVLIPAHNEEDVIGETVRGLRQLHYPAERYVVMVIADRCTDDTAQRAQEEGARCLLRTHGSDGGKGRALSWVVMTEPERLNPFDVIIVCDADTRFAPEALLALNRAFLTGIQVGQGKVQGTTQVSSLNDLVTLSETLSQEIDDTARSALDWPVPLRGTGMAFGREIFQQFCAALHTRAEDLELSLRLAAAQVSVSFVPDAVVFDPKPTDMQAATRQRARWLQGHWEVVRHYWREILQVLSRGSLGERALVISLLLRPRTLLMSLKALLLLSSLLLFFSSLSHLALFVSTGAAFALGADVVYYLLGSSLVTNPKAIQTLKRFTLYLPVWIGAVILSVFSGERWLRVRRKAAGQ